MPWPVHPNGLLGAQGDQDTYRIERSLRFNSADSAYLSRTPASAGNRKTWTWSGWVKRTALSPATVGVFEAASNASNRSVLFFTSTDTLSFFENSSGSTVTNIATNQVFRDFSSWSHIIISVDTTQSVSSERVKLYHNGTQITSFASSTYPSQNFDTQVNSTVASVIGAGTAYTPSAFINGYLTEINFIDGQALTPSSFGETDALTGRWKAKAYSGTYGTNGFYLKFADNSGTTATTLGKDSSGNGNNWTPNNFSVTAGAGNDSLVDSPTNYGSDTGVGGSVRGNYCTLSAIDKGTEATLANGNLDITWSGVNGHSARSTYAVSSGKWYWEVTSGANGFIGIIQSNIYPSLNQWPGSSVYGATGSYAYATDGRKVNNSSYSSYGSAISNGNIVGVAYDATNGKIFFSLNGTWQASGDPAAGTNPAFSSISGEYSPAIGYGGGTASNVNNLNFGQRPFAYTAPTGFKALCTTNLPTPTIKKPSSYMDAVTFTATGADQTITGFNFSPDLVWIKNRANWAGNRHTLYDTTRGAQLRLDSSTTEAEAADNDLTSFNSNGFSGNLSGTTYVAWAWDEAPIAGMDIVSYTGTGAIRTVSHNLGVAPKMIIAKLTNSAGFQWPVYHSSLTSASSYIWLNSTNAQATDAAYWGTAPTSSVFSVGTNANVNNNTSPYIAYCFAEVEGFSKFGSYTGNASTEGPFVYCGFRPKFIIVKRTDTAGEPWIIKDTSRSSYNGNDVELYANTSAAEGGPYSPPIMDYVSNGFKLRSTATGSNASGATYIFMAFAESPFKYARAR